MGQLRYVKDMSRQSNAKRGVSRNKVRSIRAVYETDVEVARSLLPRPLEPLEQPEIFVQFAHVEMDIGSGRQHTLGAATVAVRCHYEGLVGGYVLAMPMEGEGIVVKGREAFGEPKKIAQIEFEKENSRFRAAAIRHKVAFLELEGQITGPSSGPQEFTEHFFCFKGLPAIDGQGGFDGDVFLTQLDWQRRYTEVFPASGQVILRESAYDPLADVPVRRLVRMEYAEGATATSGRILRVVPGEWYQPYLPHRYDDRYHVPLELDGVGYERV